MGWHRTGCFECARCTSWPICGYCSGSWAGRNICRPAIGPLTKLALSPAPRRRVANFRGAGGEAGSSASIGPCNPIQIFWRKSIGFCGLTTTNARVERVPQAVTDEVYTQHSKRDGEAGPDHSGRRLRDVLRAVKQEPPPCREIGREA